MKYTIFLLLTQALFSPSTVAAEVNLDDMQKDLRIFMQIIETSMVGGRDRGHGHHRDQDIDVRGTYLKDQGVLLILKEGFDFGHDFDFDFNFGDIDISIPDIPIPAFNFKMNVNPNLRSQLNRRDLSDEERERIEEEIEEEQERIEEAREELNEQMEELYEAFEESLEALDENVQVQEQDLRGKLRELRRKQRRSAEKVHREAVRQQIDALRGEKLTEEEQKRIEEEFKKYSQELKANAEAYAKSIEDIKAQQKKIWDDKIKGFETKLLDVICEYGASIRSLPDNQFVTVIFQGAAPQVSGGVKDRIYVFKKSDLIDCRDGKFSKDQLKAKGQVYAF